MNLKKIGLGIVSLVALQYVMIKGIDYVESKLFEDSKQRRSTIIVKSSMGPQQDISDLILEEPVKVLSKKDSLQFLDSRYNFNEDELAKFDYWVDSTINETKKDSSYAIIVVKADYKLFLYKDGKKVHEFSIELGKNPYDAKVMEGDSASPEGLYKVKYKVEGELTELYKTLVSDYPKPEDKKRFMKLKAEGKIPPEVVSAGHNIEIHGKGTGKAGNKGGVNWTAGCAGVADEYMDVIYECMSKGDRITFVRYTSRNL